MNRRNIREHVFRMVFQKDFYDRAELPNQLLLYLEELEAPQEEKDYLIERALKVVDLSDEIDQEIDRVSERWRVGRIGKTDLAILRLAVYEMNHDEDVPAGVAINEAVELAKKYGGDQSYGFVNGILAKLVRE
jgi:N utilization substance protein B